MNPISELTLDCSKNQMAIKSESEQRMETDKFLPGSACDLDSASIECRDVKNLQYLPEKAGAKCRGKEYFIKNLSSILSCEKVLYSDQFFCFPLELNSKDNKIETKVCFSTAEIEQATKDLSENKFVFIIHCSRELSGVWIQIGLFTDEFDVKNIPLFIRCLKDGIEFFCFDFFLEFSKDDSLKVINPSREVNEKYRRKGLCKNISLRLLTQIYKL